jgi:hypothetical protein
LCHTLPSAAEAGNNRHRALLAHVNDAVVGQHSGTTAPSILSMQAHATCALLTCHPDHPRAAQIQGGLLGDGHASAGVLCRVYFCCVRVHLGVRCALSPDSQHSSVLAMADLVETPCWGFRRVLWCWWLLCWCWCEVVCTESRARPRSSLAHFHSPTHTPHQRPCTQVLRPSPAVHTSCVGVCHRLLRTRVAAQHLPGWCLFVCLFVCLPDNPFSSLFWLYYARAHTHTHTYTHTHSLTHSFTRSLTHAVLLSPTIPTHAHQQTLFEEPTLLLARREDNRLRVFTYMERYSTTYVATILSCARTSHHSLLCKD